MMVAQSLRLKRGDSLIWNCTRTDRTNLSNITITSQMRKLSDVIDLTVEITNADSGSFTLSALPSVTATMKAGIWQFDVQFIDSNGIVLSTETHTCLVENDVTRV